MYSLLLRNCTSCHTAHVCVLCNSQKKIKIASLYGITLCSVRTIILPVVLYGFETWSLTLREERRLRVFENRVLRRVFGPKRDEVTGE